MAHGFFHPTSTPTPKSDAAQTKAHGVRAFRDVMTRRHAGADVVPIVSVDDELIDIIAALHAAPMKSFDLSTAAVISGPFIEGRVCIRLNGRSWSLPTMSCAVLAMLVQLEMELRGYNLFASAFRTAVHEAEAKVDAVNAWSNRIRPTTEEEG
ncbi:hypothetical protein [Brevundimonas faecalis]|uniref:Uncharacterized protein n=1 Tax=Brevundimonas faecalis TaxID=947378 RepID=A0ABV2RAU7_9CAUL